MSPSDKDRLIARRALKRYSEVQAARVRKLYNRHRAVYAEFLVEQLLTGSVVVEDPTSSWDLIWPVNGHEARVQVKCSGSYLPRTQKHGSKATWDVAAPKKGWDEVSRLELAAGHHCDLFILARHEGDDIEKGWSFAALNRELIEGKKKLTMKSLKSSLVEPGDLEDTARRLLGVTPDE